MIYHINSPNLEIARHVEIDLILLHRMTFYKSNALLFSIGYIMGL